MCWGEETWEGEEKGVGKRWGGVGGLGEVRGVEKCGGDVEKCVGGMGDWGRCGDVGRGGRSVGRGVRKCVGV